MSRKQLSVFDPLEMMDLRSKAGAVLNNVFDHHKRYIIRRQGTPKALLVPIADQPAIERAISDRQLDKMYTALDKMKGMIKDNDSTDVSHRINEYAYGTTDEQETDD